MSKMLGYQRGKGEAIHQMETRMGSLYMSVSVEKRYWDHGFYSLAHVSSFYMNKKSPTFGFVHK